ncbi:MAG: hypothetical protein HKN28_18110 [Alphaproteobacteria bacterium]|nr:hypothetical protein [Alphaproteobacteria bacterium]
MIRNLSVRHKVTAITVMTTTIVLALASLLFVGLEINNYRRALVQELTAIAQISASNSTAAIIFDDKAAAEETLAALDARPNIETAAIFTPDGRLFAGQTAATAGAAEEQMQPYLAELLRDDDPTFEFIWTLQSVDLYGPIELDGQTIGIIHIRSNLDQIIATIWTYLAVVMMIIGLAIGLAWFLAARLQRQFTAPIFGLVDTVNAVARERDYSLRAPKHSSDELGAAGGRVQHDVGRDRSPQDRTEFGAKRSRIRQPYEKRFSRPDEP